MYLSFGLCIFLYPSLIHKAGGIRGVYGFGKHHQKVPEEDNGLNTNITVATITTKPVKGEKVQFVSELYLKIVKILWS